MLLSVVIPTHNRSKILRECIEALSKQDLPKKDFEVIVIDDGSTDDTKKVMQSLENTYENVFYYHQNNQGQGIARNLGVQHAEGGIVVFIGDDIIVRPDFLSEHLRYHLRYDKENEAVLGFTTWHPKLPINEFMRWTANGSSVLGRFGGHQFAYEKLESKTQADYNFFYTSNISLKRSLIDKYPFDPSFSGYGWEDIELGYRLHQRENLKLYYNANAIGHHDHFMDETSLANRMKSIGKSAWIFHRKYPELRKIPSLQKSFIFRILSSRPMIRFLGWLNQDLYFYALSKGYFLEGLREGKKDQQRFLAMKS